MVNIEFSKNSKKQLEKLNARIQQKILFTLRKFKEGGKVDVIKLKNKNQEFRIRTGNYRIQLQKVKEVFLVTKIGKRENFYLVFI
ncbi:type II toxin-antitoxin system RelE/ParE family toxin [Candidatus Pacearchaeota archaeon]|nr:type II toxin-antitoxin system RelE/ParE family toxin [Candidatus Pacearchaeota archaeon]